MRWHELTKEQLIKLPIKRLLNILKIARLAAHGSQYCECCGESWQYLYGEDDERAIRAKEFWERYEMIKSICDKREHCEQR